MTLCLLYCFRLSYSFAPSLPIDFLPGTGKTLAFLVPVIERVVRNRHKDTHTTTTTTTHQRPRPIYTLIISPSRELAQQIEQEAKRLTKFEPSFQQACVVGGINIKRDLRILQDRSKGSLDLLIGTPGRILDLLKNHDGVRESLSHLKCLVLDEADRLLDMGFKRDLDAIFAMLPPSTKRQTMLLSVKTHRRYDNSSGQPVKTFEQDRSRPASNHPVGIHSQASKWTCFEPISVMQVCMFCVGHRLLRLISCHVHCVPVSLCSLAPLLFLMMFNRSRSVLLKAIIS